MFGSIVSWGLMWPLISQKEGEWYPAGLSSTDFRGLYGYKVRTAGAGRAGVWQPRAAGIALDAGAALTRPARHGHPPALLRRSSSLSLCS